MSIESPIHASDADRSGWMVWASFCVLGAGLAWLAYRGMVGQTFLLLWDDGDVLNNPMIQGLDWGGLRWAVSTFEGSNWKPLTWLSLALDHALWGENALGYKLHNLLLHALSSVLVALLIERLLGDALRRSGRSTAGLRSASLAAGLLFLVHPQHVESVVWISERKDVLFALFYLAALYAHVRAIQAPQARAWPELTKISAVLSMLAKPMAVSLPVALVLLDLYQDRPQGWRQAWCFLGTSLRRNAVVFLMAAVVAWIITQAVADTDLPTPLGLPARLANACFAVLFYVYGFFAPFDLSTYYQFPAWILSLSWVAVGPPLVLLGALALAVMAWRRGHHAPLLLLLFAGVALLPASGIKQVILLTYADRFAYIPGLPLYLFFALLLMRAQGAARHVVMGAVLVLLPLLALETSRHVEWWRDDEALFQRVIERDPGRVALAYHRLAEVARKRGEPREGLLRAALAAEPWNPSVRLDLAAHLIELGRRDEALPLLVAIGRERPDAKQHMIQVIRLLLLAGQVDLAQEAVRRALEANPDNLALLNEDARIKARRGVALNDDERGRWVGALERGRYDPKAARELAALDMPKGGLASGDLVAAWRALTRNPSLLRSGREERAWVFHQLGLAELNAGLGGAAAADFGLALAESGDTTLGLAQVALLMEHSLPCEASAHLERVGALLPRDAKALSRGSYYPREIARLRASLDAQGGRCATRSAPPGGNGRPLTE